MPSRTFHRPRRSRILGRKAIVVCEGEKTELMYFDAIRQFMRLPTLRMRVVHPEGTDPLTIVRAAVEEKRAQVSDRAWFAGDLAWAVFDGDEHRRANATRWNDAIQLATGNQIKLAISNPNFELWYLLHFQAQNAHIERAAAVQSLRRHIGNYQKSMVLWPDPLQPKTDAAIARATQLLERADLDGLVPFSNPSTGVHELVQSILALR